nr:nacrein-like protein C1 [Lytechinus pictus]
MDKAEYYASPALQEEFGNVIKNNDVKRAIYLSPNKGNEGSPIKVVTISPTKAIHLRSMLTVSPAKMNEPTTSKDPELASVDFALQSIQYELEANDDDDPTNIMESNGDDSDADYEGKGDEGIDDNNGVIAPIDGGNNDGNDNDNGDDGQDNDNGDNGQDNENSENNDGEDNDDSEDNDVQDNGNSEDDDDEQDSEDLDDKTSTQLKRSSKLVLRVAKKNIL